MCISAFTDNTIFSCQLPPCLNLFAVYGSKCFTIQTFSYWWSSLWLSNFPQRLGEQLVHYRGRYSSASININPAACFASLRSNLDNQKRPSEEMKCMKYNFTFPSLYFYQWTKTRQVTKSATANQIVVFLLQFQLEKQFLLFVHFQFDSIWSTFVCLCLRKVTICNLQFLASQHQNNHQN